MNNKINNKGKMVYCKETYQIFPSAKAAAEHHNMKCDDIYNHLNDRSKSAKGKHFVYIENTADISNFFASERRAEKEREAMRRAAEERVIKLEAEQKKLAKKLAEARKIARRV